VSKKKVLVIGLDCATPQLVFGQWKDELPNLRHLMETGIYGELESTIPPITCPAWMSMMTSKDPGELGVYGFRNRKDYSYYGMQLVNSRVIKEDAVWDVLSKWGRKVVLISVPPSYPPKPVNGYVVTCFMTPNADCQYTYPAEFKQEVERVVGRYQFDVENFRSEEKERILRQLYEMAEKRFKLLKHMIQNRDWDFTMMVEIGVDRLHHGFWKYFDPTHPKYQPGSPFETAVKDYYLYIDGKIGEILPVLDDNTTVLIVSDHGAKKLDGGICINEWLIKEGCLTLKQRPAQMTPFEKAEVEWDKTQAWGEGGYYARIFMNVKGRESNGVIDPKDYERVRDELAAKLMALEDHTGKNIGTKVFKPEQIYRACRGIAPDLIVYFGNLHWRSVGSVGHPAIWTFENDTGPDDANHAQHGIFIMSPHPKRGTKVEGLHLMDCAPTILSLFGLPVPSDMQGKIIEN
jgi:predicted AlkP superfamily phosphohydrolase/phosphomutase